LILEATRSLDLESIRQPDVFGRGADHHTELERVKSFKSAK